MNGVTSTIYDMEMARLDQEIEKTGKQFYSALLRKKRRVKRKWLEISAMTNAHLLQTLPYRAMLGHVAKIAEERDKVIAEMISQQPSTQSDKDEDVKDEDDGNNDDDDKDAFLSSQPELVSSTEQQKEHFTTKPGLARDDINQTEDRNFLLTERTDR